MMDERWYGEPPAPAKRKGRGWGKAKMLVAMVGLAAGVALVVIVGHRLSDEALAVLAGAVCGVGAAIPTSLLIVAVSRRRSENEQARERRVRTPGPYGQEGYPPVVVVAPPGAYAMPSQLPQNTGAVWDHGPAVRRFHVVGEEGNRE